MLKRKGAKTCIHRIPVNGLSLLCHCHEQCGIGCESKVDIHKQIQELAL